MYVRVGQFDHFYELLFSQIFLSILIFFWFTKKIIVFSGVIFDIFGGFNPH